ncbi:MAG: choice-of-anchor D domain-containing protein [Bacteroidaceae bacterium]|nr:choice-of-anchor D domain-containing protein [Bacteroidaceae bacterium]
MRRLLLGLLFPLCWIGLAYADNSVVVSASDGQPGEIITIKVAMSATDRVVAAEFSIPILEGLSYEKESFKAIATGMSSSSVLIGNELRVYFYSADLNNSQLSNGDLFSFNVRLGRTPGLFMIKPSAVLSDVAGNPLSVKVTGKNITIKAPQIRISADTVDFGHIALRSTYRKSVGITNIGTIPLNVSSITGSSGDLQLSETSFSLASGSTKQLTISYTPSNVGKQEMTLMIESDAIDNASSVLAIISDPYTVNQLTVSNQSGDFDSDISVELAMDNMEDIAAFQCSFTLPEGISYVDNSFVPTDRLKDMISFVVVENGVLRLFAYSDSEGLIKEGSGNVASFKLHLGTSNGQYNLVPENVIISNKGFVNVLSGITNGLVEVKSPLIACSSTIDLGETSLAVVATGLLKIQNPGKKDLVIDKVTFNDASFSMKEICPIIINAGSSKSIEISYKPDSSGVYSSGMSLYTNVPDVRVVDVEIVGSVYEPNFITSDIKLSPDKTNGSVIVGLSNYGNITGIEMNVYGLENMKVDMSSLSLSERCAGFSYSMSMNDDGSVKVLIYSLSNNPISGNTGELFSLNFECRKIENGIITVKITDIVLSDETGRNICGDDENSVTITTVRMIKQTENDDLFDMAGRNMVNDVNKLLPGIYIRNGRKMIVR